MRLFSGVLERVQVHDKNYFKYKNCQWWRMMVSGCSDPTMRCDQINFLNLKHPVKLSFLKPALSDIRWIYVTLTILTKGFTKDLKDWWLKL